MRDYKVRALTIQFDRNNGTYIPGEVVSGRILVHLTHPKQIRGLQVTILGESVVQWSERDKSVDESDPNDDSQPSQTMTGYEEHFFLTFYLLGSKAGPFFMLPAGEVAYPFKYQLPFNVPSSFEHKHGYVTYTIKASFDKSSTFNREVITAFTVISTYDLNRKPEATLPIQAEINKNFFCSCIFSTGKIHATFSVPSAGFVPGQVIPVTVLCENESTVDVEKIKVSLRRKIKFHARSPHSSTVTDKSIIAETNCLAPFTQDSEEDVTIRLKVPPSPPTGLEHCGLIDVSYVLRVVMCFSGMHFSVKRHFPILIGTVPLLKSGNTYKSNVGRLPSAVIPYPSPCWDPKNSAPPSYDASMCGVRTLGSTNEFVHVHGAGYPIYDYSPASTAPDPPMYGKWTRS